MSYPFVAAFHDLGPARGPRLAMCWHMAEGGGTVGFLSRANANGVSVHFVIETSGRIVQMLALDHMHSSIRASDIRTTDDPPFTYQGETVTYGRTAARSALGDWADIAHGTLGPNHATIAVEVEGFAKAGPNTAQTAAIDALARDLGLPANLGHRDFADYKACPGKRYPWPSAGGHGSTNTEETMIVAQQLAHVVTTRLAHLYSAPDTVKRLPSTLAKGTRLRKFGGAPGWQFVEVNYGGIQQYAWLKSDDVALDPQPLTVTDGPVVDTSSLERELAAANERIRKGITVLGGTTT